MSPPIEQSALHSERVVDGGDADVFPFEVFNCFLDVVHVDKNVEKIH